MNSLNNEFSHLYKAIRDFNGLGIPLGTENATWFEPVLNHFTKLAEIYSTICFLPELLPS